MMDTLRTVWKFVALVKRLREVPRWQPQQLRQVQEQRLRALLADAKRDSAFWAERLADVDVATGRLEDIPPLTKAEMMGSFDRLVTDPRVKLDEVVSFMREPSNLGTYYLDRYALLHTAGTQGRPAVIMQTRDEVELSFLAQVARASTTLNREGVFKQALLRPFRIALVTQRPGFYPSGCAFAYLPREIRRLMEVLQLSVFDPMTDIVEKLTAFRPTHVIGYACILDAMAREARAGRLPLPDLHQITNFGEPLSPAARQDVQAAFGVHVADQYSAGECQALSSGCPVAAGSHVNADLVIVEVVDRDNRPVPPGTPGAKVLITDLVKRVQPLIRYEIGDVVTMSPTPCPCGSVLPLIQRVDGREMDRFWVEEAGEVRELPYYLFLVSLNHCSPLAEHRVLQTGHNRFTIQCVPVPGQTLDPELPRRLVKARLALERIGTSAQIDVQIVAEIPRESGSGKVRRTVNLYGKPAPWMEAA